MDVSISWSGERSRIVATALRNNLGMVIQSVTPFLSTNDIRGGARWFPEIGEKLNSSNYGIICLTPENLTSHWIHFEAGAIAKNVAESRVCCYLIDVPHSNVLQPLSQFHNRLANSEGTWNLLCDINKALPHGQLEETPLSKLFNSVFWPDIENALKSASLVAGESADSQQERSDKSKLDEVLDLLRTVATETNKWSQVIRDPLDPCEILKHLEKQGRLKQMAMYARAVSSDRLRDLASEIDCGPLCDTIWETLDERGENGSGSGTSSWQQYPERYGSGSG